MKKLLLCMVVSVCLSTINVFATSVWSGGSDIFTHGSGTQANPYLIETADQLSFIAEMVNAGVTDYSGNYFKQTADFDLNNIAWTPIGDNTHPFGGNYDGDGHSINNLSITLGTDVGLFGVVTGGVFKKLTLSGAITASATNAGGLIGQSTSFVTIDSCTNMVSIKNATNAGGIIGNASSCSLLMCNNKASITSKSTAGGMIGTSGGARIVRSQNISSIESTTYLGGIIGKSEGEVYIDEVVNFGVGTSNTNYILKKTSKITNSILNDYPTISYYYIDSTYTYSTVGYSGGIIGYCSQKTTIQNSSNYGNVNIQANLSTQCLYNEFLKYSKYYYYYISRIYEVNSDVYSGGLCGYIKEGNINNCRNIASSIKGTTSVNLGRYAINEQINNNCVYVKSVVINEHSYNGGLVGSSPTVIITHSVNCSNVTNGFIGSTTNSAISYSYNNGMVQNGFGNSGVKVLNSYNAGSTSNLGLSSGTITNSYYINGSGKGTIKTETQMKSVTMPILLNADSTVFIQDVKPNVNHGYPIFKDGMKYVSTNDPSDVSYTYIELQGAYYGFTPDSIGFERMLSPNNWCSVVCATPSFRWNALDKGQQYTFRFWGAVNGIKYYGDIISVTTLDCPSNPVRIDTVRLCEGETYHFAGKDLSQAGTYQDSYIATTGCDSIIQLVLEIYDTYKYTREATINRGESYEFYGQYLTEPGVYNEYIPTTNRCNWVQLTLHVIEPDKTLSLSSNNPLWGSVTGAGTYTHGEVVEFSAIPSTGYHFVNWSDGVTTPTRAIRLTSDTTIIANFAINQYTISAIATNGNVSGTGTYDYGEEITLTAIANEHYHFVKWNDGNTSAVRTIIVSDNATYTAIFSIDEFSIKFINSDGTILQDTKVAYGLTPTYTGSTPNKEATEKYSYIFKDWYPTITSVEADAIYTATYDSITNQYTVQFVNDDGEVLQSGLVAYGQMPVYEGLTPSKPSTAMYTYTFTGWSPELTSVTGTATYTAIYTSTINKYAIRFVDEDGTELQSSLVAYGQMPVYEGVTPSKPSTAMYTYTFTGWSPELTSVTGTATYTATYKSNAKKYTISFIDADGTILQTSKVEYGQTPVYNGVTPTKSSTAEYTYTFAGWMPEIVSVTGDATYTATYSRTINQYTISFVDEDGTILQTSKVQYGQMPAYIGETPTKFATAQYTYTFSGWTPNIVMVTGNATYKATYKETTNKYQIVVSGENCSISGGGTYEYGSTVTLVATPDEGYYFVSWSDGVLEATRQIYVTEDAYYSAITEKIIETGMSENTQKEDVTKIFDGMNFYILRGDKRYTMQGQLVK